MSRFEIQVCCSAVEMFAGIKKKEEEDGLGINVQRLSLLSILVCAENIGRVVHKSASLWHRCAKN